MSTKMQDYVVTHLQDAYAMEQNVLAMLDSMIATTDDPETKLLLQNHRAETVQHGVRVEARLKALGQATSLTKTAVAAMGGMFKMAVDMMRPEKACKNLRDGFITEHGEIAGYELLERYAKRANDAETAAVARQNKAEEVAMADRLSKLWDRAVDHDLEAAGIDADVAGVRTPDATLGKRAEWAGSSAEADMGIGTQPHPTPIHKQVLTVDEFNSPSQSDPGTRTSIPQTRNP